MWEMLWKWIKANPDLTAYITTAIGTIFGWFFHIYSRILRHSREIKQLWSKHRDDIKAIQIKHVENIKAMQEKHDDGIKAINHKIEELEKRSDCIDDLVSRKFDALLLELTAQGKSLARIEGYIESQKAQETK